MLGFKPYGLKKCHIEPLQLKFEEYESIRLVNYERLSQDEAAREMNISRPTFTRIHNNALKTIARSVVEGKVLEFEGGDYSLDKDWYRCRRCFMLIEGLENHKKCEDCSAYGDNELMKLN